MIFEIKQWESKYLKDFHLVKSGIVSEYDLYNKFSLMYYNFVSTYGKEPFTISYGRANGFCINTNSYVGIITYDDVTFYIKSMIPELSLGKILYMKSKSTLESQETKTGNVIKSLMDDEITIEAVDYYIVSLLDCIERIYQNGMISENVSENCVTSSVQGKIDIPRQIKNSPAYEKMYVTRNVQSLDNNINRLLRAALEKSKQLSKLEWVLPYINHAINRFETVKVIEDVKELENVSVASYTTLRRTDYEDALIFSKYILFGFDPIEGENMAMFPEFIIDMNTLFENYVTSGLKKIFKKGFTQKALFTLGLGDVDPSLEERNIELDGYYSLDGKSVVLDTKNKYRRVIDGNITNFIPMNPDLYQQYYYASRLNSNNVILVYPSSKKKTAPIGHYYIEFEGCKRVDFYCWGLNITGTPRESKLALVGLASFIDSLR